MRKESNKEYIVRTTTTGYIEADMLGHVINVSEEMSAKQKSSQRPHRKDMKERQYKSGLRAALDRYGERYQTAPTACWRRLKRLISFSNRYGRKLASVMRRNKLNGK